MASQPSPSAPSITRRHGIVWSKTPFPSQLQHQHQHQHEHQHQQQDHKQQDHKQQDHKQQDHKQQDHKQQQGEDYDYTEPTSTIVTSSPTGQFVDIRLTLHKSTQHAHIAPGPASLEPRSEFKALEWGIAGQATYSTSSGDVKHGKWTHWISSLGGSSSSNEEEEDPADEGDMVIDPVTGRVVESGRMRNLESGELEYYREVWADVDVRMPGPVPGAATVGAGAASWGMDGGGLGERQNGVQLRQGKRSYVVVRCEHEDRDVRGLIVWVGQYCQGVFREGNKFTAERWEYDFVASEWVRTFRVGEGSLPCGWLVKESDGIKRGETLCPPKLLGERDRWIIVDEDFTVTES